MSTIKLASVALNQTPLDWEGNFRRIETAIHKAREQNISILCLPELCVTGYGCEDTFFSDSVIERGYDGVQKLAQLTEGMFVGFGIPVLFQDRRYNGIAVAIDGAVRGIVLKQFLANDGIHYESRWFSPWQRGQREELTMLDAVMPLGDLQFDISGLRIGFEICRDAWVEDRPAIKLASRGIDIILNPSASHFAFGKHEIRKRLVVEGSKLCNVGYVFSNLLGCESGRTIYDGDTLIAVNGEMIACGERFRFSEAPMVSAVLDASCVQGNIEKRREQDDNCIIVDDVSLVEEDSAEKISRPVSPRRTEKQDEFEGAVTLALFDYARKSRAHGFVVSLSGGVDSSATSCLVALMVRRSVSELGLNGFAEIFSYVPGISAAKSSTEIVKCILTCVYQATKNSSQETHEAARCLAEQLQASWCDLNVQEIVEAYHALIEKSMGISLSWDKHDTALQNIQARVRSPSVWMIANLRNALLLATSNRSEASVGYTTMDGDSSGGLAPLGGVDKAFLREWLLWLERREGGELSALSLVNAQAPTAELRPPMSNQRDEDDLMPYRVLDGIERYAVRDHLDPVAIFKKLSTELSESYSKKEIAGWIERFFLLWCRNQWKRERLAVSFHLDDENVDPKTFCRFPVLSSGFDAELRQLRELAKGER